MLKMGVLRVTSTKKPPIRHKINIRSPWLAELGFIPGGAVFASPEQDGFTLTLQNATQNIAQGNACGNGKLIHVGAERIDKKPALSLNFANNFATTGLSGGDFLIAQYQYGLITARKIPDVQKCYIVDARNHGPYLRLNGAWLSDIGFSLDSIVTADISRDFIILRLWDDPAATYDDIVKFARPNKLQVLQAQKNQHITFIDLDAHILERAGLESGDICGICHKYGAFTLFKPDLKKLGF